MHHFGFTKLVVTDLDAAHAFYRDVFGLTEQARVSADIGDRAIDEIMYAPTAPGGASFVLLRFTDAPDPAPAGVIPGFVTDDVDATVERAVAAGGSVVAAAHDMPEHGVRVAFVADIEGRLIELVQMLAG